MARLGMFFAKNGKLTWQCFRYAVYRRNDAWAFEVKVRIPYVNDLRVEDAIYHIDCNTCFHLLRPRARLTGSESRKKRRPVDIDRETAFKNI